MEPLTPHPRLGIFGFGEVGYYTAKGLSEAGLREIYAYNNGRRHRPPYDDAYRAHAREAGTVLVDSVKDLAARADVLLVVTTPGSVVRNAEEAAPHLAARHLYVDMNSSGPRAKREAFAIVEPTGARFVDASFMAGAVQSGHRGLAFLSGPGAEEYQRLMTPFGMDFEVMKDAPVGHAALIKMLRSIQTKGTMTIMWELSYAALKAGIDLKQYRRALPAFPQDVFAAADRVVGLGYRHVRRRAEESRDMQETLREYGVEPHLAEAYEKRLNWAAQFEEDLRRRFEGGPDPSAVDVLTYVMELEGKQRGG